LLHLSVERNPIQLGCPADTSGALIERTIVYFEPLGKADLAARDLGDDIETQRRRFAANLSSRLGGTRLDKKSQAQALQRGAQC
jgi:hypothetical protein